MELHRPQQRNLQNFCATHNAFGSILSNDVPLTRYTVFHESLSIRRHSQMALRQKMERNIHNHQWLKTIINIRGNSNTPRIVHKKKPCPHKTRLNGKDLDEDCLTKHKIQLVIAAYSSLFWGTQGTSIISARPTRNRKARFTREFS